MSDIRGIRFLTVLFFVLSGCSTVDFSSQTLRHQRALSELEAYGRQILGQTAKRMDPEGKWKDLDQWDVVTVDEWSSPLLRAFTPIKQPRQKVRFVFALDNDDVAMHYMDGKDKGSVVGLEKGKSYITRNGKQRFQGIGTGKIYLEGVKNYFMWPLTLRQAPFVSYSEDLEEPRRSYQKIFVSGGNIVANTKEDQYIVWVNKQTQLVDYIEFTMRDLWPSYRGVIEYRDYRNVDGFLMPFEIELRGELDDKKYDHRFHVESMSLQ